MIRSTTTLFLITGCGLLLALCQSVLARTAQVSVNVRGEILAPAPCVINGNTTLAVSFGSDLTATQIDGGNYLKQVPYTVTCGMQPTRNMTIELQGVGAGFDGALLTTSESNLGIKFLMGGTAWPLNKPVDFTYPLLPKMEAVLIRKKGGALIGGAFSASATIVVALR